MAKILDQKQRLIEEHLLGFSWRNIVLVVALVRIAIIPLETCNCVQINQKRTSSSYTQLQLICMLTVWIPAFAGMTGARAELVSVREPLPIEHRQPLPHRSVRFDTRDANFGTHHFF